MNKPIRSKTGVKIVIGKTTLFKEYNKLKNGLKLKLNIICCTFGFFLIVLCCKW